MPQVTQNLSPRQIKVSAEVMPRISDMGDPFVDLYADIMRRYDDFPPLDVVYEAKTKTHWLADGSYRMNAHMKLGHATIPCRVMDGTRNDAIWRAAGANAKHPIRLSSKQTDRALTLLMEIPEFAEQSNQTIADHVGCGLIRVAKIKAAVERAQARAAKAKAATEHEINTEFAAASAELEEEEADEAKPNIAETAAVTPGEEEEPESVAGKRRVVRRDGAITYRSRKGNPGAGRPSRSAAGTARSLRKGEAKDKIGQVIPSWLKSVALDSLKIDALLTDISETAKKAQKIKALASGAGKLVDTQEVRSCVEEYRRVIQAARFFAACPECLAAGKVRKGCPCCKGKGWLSDAEFTEKKLQGGLS